VPEAAQFPRRRRRAPVVDAPRGALGRGGARGGCPPTSPTPPYTLLSRLRGCEWRCATWETAYEGEHRRAAAALDVTANGITDRVRVWRAAPRPAAQRARRSAGVAARLKAARPRTVLRAWVRMSRCRLPRCLTCNPQCGFLCRRQPVRCEGGARDGRMMITPTRGRQRGGGAPRIPSCVWLRACTDGPRGCAVRTVMAD